MANAASTMDIDETLAISLEKMKKLGDVNNEQLPNTCIEKYVADKISALLDAEAPISEAWMTYVQNFEDQTRDGVIELSGSVVEGAMMARIFQPNKNLEVEVDVMANIFTIPQEVSHLLEPVKDKPGFVRLPFSLCPLLFIWHYVNIAKKFLSRRENEHYSLDQILQYVSPLVIRDTVKDTFDHVPVSDHVAHMFGMDSVQFPFPRTNFSTTATTVAGEMSTTVAGELPAGALFPVISNDWVPAVHLSCWPGQASNWIIRYRVWPPHDIIQSIVDRGCQIVPRTSQGGDVHSEWRLSFSRPEAALANLRSRRQKQAYYFVKVFFYRNLKCVESSETDGKTIYSYIIKTIMLWACEELHPEDPIWASLENSVQMLLFKLLGSLEVGFLSHYFIPEINLLETVGQDVRNQCVSVISRWISNILMTAPFDMPEKWKTVNNLANLYSILPLLGTSCSEMLEIVRKKYREYAKKH